MKQAINDDAQVQALCERLGAWPAISASIAAGHSGVVTAGAWVVGYFSDGLAAVEDGDNCNTVCYKPKIRHMLAVIKECP